MVPIVQHSGVIFGRAYGILLENFGMFFVELWGEVPDNNLTAFDCLAG